MFTVNRIAGFVALPHLPQEDAWIVIRCRTCSVQQTLTNLGKAGEKERDPTGRSFQTDGNEVTRQLVCTGNASHTGSITYTLTRIAPTNFGLSIVPACANEADHPKRRVLVSYISLCLLYRLVRAERVPKNATVEAPGASLKRNGNTSRPGHNQLAHQILREITINGKFYYKLPGLDETEKKVLVYCHCVCSDIPTAFNQADGFLEQKIRAPYLTFARRILNDELSSFSHVRTKAPGAKVGGAFPEILKTLITMFITACDEGRTVAETDQHKQIIDGYKAAALAMETKAHIIADQEFDHWVETIKDGIQSF